MTSILVAICRISGNNFRCHFVKKEKLFVDSLLYSWNVHESWNICQKKDEYLSLITSEIIESETGGYLNV